MFTSNTPGLRIYGRDRRSFKFVAGKYGPATEEDAEDIRAFAAAYPQYGIQEPDAPEPEEEPEEEDGDDLDLEKLTVPELQELARQRDLPVGGNKAALIERLREEE